MAEREDWCSNQVSKLQVEDLRIPALNEIKDHFAAISQEEASRAAKKLDLSLVFDCLNDSNSEQVELACEVLAQCLSNLQLGESTSRYSVPLERALNHPSSNVQIMALEEVQRIILNNDVSDKCSLINAITRCIGVDNLAVVKRASSVIVTLGSTPTGIKQLLSENCLKTINETMVSSEVVRLRFNEIFIEISKMSEPSMRALHSHGLSTQLLQDLENNDVLLKMNVVELLGQLAVTKHGYHYLETEGVIIKILQQVQNDDPLLSQLCEPGILKFFGNVAHWKPTEVLSKYPYIMDKIYSNIENSGNVTLFGVSLDTLGHIGETNEGKYALESTGTKFVEALKAISYCIQSLSMEPKIRSAACFESLIRVTTFDSRITNLIRKWYFTMGDNPIEWIEKVAKNPFCEIRQAGLGILNALASHHWGQECFRMAPGLIEFLLDRRIETVKECKEAKYEIVKILSTSSVFDHSTLSRLQEFVKEGPFYVQAVTTVAMERED